ncbi:MAG: GGDEF domain-containing phosphodiesterase [Saccharofermentans sp.]|nr:GGDEF domain-containing phosphodiesterase [Saccharofermentans sp.]
MFINKLNQLYKPKRILYYIDADENALAAFYSGKIPDEAGRYANAFGTYDYPGIFYVKSLGRPVIGIEFRAGDENALYPSDLKSVTLDDAFFYSIEIDNEIEVNLNSINDIFAKIRKDDDAHRNYSDLSVKEDPEVISVFLSGKKIRILYEMQIDSDHAIEIINDEHDALGKKELYKKAYIDSITNHYNWNHLVPFLEMPMDYGISDYAFVHFDVKEFRVINEVYGHIAANKVLCNVVKAMNESDFVYTSARCHNDNFAMMIKDMPEEKMISRLEEFFEDLSHLEEDPNYKIYYRCGVVPMQRSLLSGNRVADAGKLAQKLGTNHNKTDIIIFTDKMHEDILWGNYIKAYLDTAVENDEFTIYLQPKFDIRNGKIKGAEALIRWNYKKKEFLYPGRFIPFFERDGSIGKIDDIVLKKVCMAFDKWKKEGRILYPVSVNLSRDRLYDKNLVKHLTEIVDSYNVYHDLIDFELTESASYDNTEQMIHVLNELRDQGFHISMDDFGTGYSSFSLLTQMPLDTLKIDKSFVDKVGVENMIAKDVYVIRHIISLAKELGFVCLAEGAESKSQIDELRALGCDVVQGYYYSKPIPIEEYENRYLS